MNNEHIRIAKRMLGLREDEFLPKSLMQRLQRVRDLVQKGRETGDLVSTQTIATIIEQWERGQHEVG